MLHRTAGVLLASVCSASPGGGSYDCHRQLRPTADPQRRVAVERPAGAGVVLEPEQELGELLVLLVAALLAERPPDSVEAMQPRDRPRQAVDGLRRAGAAQQAVVVAR